MMLQLSQVYIEKKGQWIVVLATVIIGLSVAFYLYNLDKYSLVYFGDAASHMLGARKIVDWTDPGLQQLGTVWLPLPHFMLLPFTLIDPLFTTGFAGVAVSLPSLVITSMLIYKMARRHIGSTLVYIPLIAAMLYATNPNIIYMGITAMTEAPFMLFFVASAYYFQKWLGDQGRLSRNMAYCAIFISLATLSRYEGWILPMFLIPAVAIMALKNKSTMSKTKIHAILFSFISISGIVFWLAYNASLYGDPLEFANADYYSAASQAENRSIRETLFLKPANVIWVYSYTAYMMYGPILLGAAVAGFVMQAMRKKGNNNSNMNNSATDINISDPKRLNSRILVYIFLGLPSLFTLIMLLIGVGEMTFWFNSRFLILLAPLAVLLASIFIKSVWEKFGTEKANGKKILLPVSIIVALFVFQLATPAFGVVTYLDAIGGFSYHINPYAVQTGEALNSLYDGGGIMMLTGSAQEHRIMLTSGISLRQFDEIIESSTWKKSYYEPWSYDRWIVISKSPDSDGVKTTRYWAEERRAELDQHYKKVYENRFYEILVRN